MPIRRGRREVWFWWETPRLRNVGKGYIEGTDPRTFRVPDWRATLPWWFILGLVIVFAFLIFLVLRH